MRSRFGTIQKHGNGYRIFWQQGGKKRSKVIHGTRKEAELALASIQLEETGEVYVTSWQDYWDAVVVPSFEGLADKTVYEYKRLWNRELKGRIGSSNVCDLTTRRVESVLADIDSDWEAAATARLIKKICNMAVHDCLMKSNPVMNAKKRKAKKKRKILYDASEIGGLLDAIEGIKYEPVILMELGGGLRHEEACVMCHEDITEYMENGNRYALVDVNKALVDVDGRKILKETKNGFSEREVVIGEPFASRLLSCVHGEGAILNSRVAASGDYKAENFTSPVTVTHNWRQWCKRNNVKYVCPKNMRSTYATIHGECGSPDSLVSGSMGHADATTKARNYQAITRRGLVLIADNLTEHLGRF